MDRTPEERFVCNHLMAKGGTSNKNSRHPLAGVRPDTGEDGINDNFDEGVDYDEEDAGSINAVYVESLQQYETFP